MMPCARAAAALLVCAGACARGQTPTSELWPELDVFWRPAEHQRTVLELSGSTDQDGPKREASVGLYEDYLRLPKAYLRAGYRFTFSTRDASYRESRLIGEAVGTPYAAGLVRLVNRARLELRWVNGAYSYRVRERVHFQRVPPKPTGLALAPYGTLEAYFDSRYNTIARLGGRVGSEAQLSRRVAIDLYVARQNNSRDLPRYVNALGLTAKVTISRTVAKNARDR